MHVVVVFKSAEKAANPSLGIWAQLLLGALAGFEDLSLNATFGTVPRFISHETPALNTDLGHAVGAVVVAEHYAQFSPW